jgi:hypothetical protein
MPARTFRSYFKENTCITIIKIIWLIKLHQENALIKWSLKSSTLHENLNGLTIFIKLLNIKVYENPLSHSQVVTCVQTDRPIKWF